MKSLVLLINNPVAKKSSENKIKQACSIFTSKGFSVEVFVTKQKGDAENFARNSLKENPAIIVAAGGDGTVNEIANGIVGSEIPLAILPLGTTNVLAKEIGIPEDIKSAVNIAAQNSFKNISTGKITLLEFPDITRYFLLMAGIGYDGETVYNIDENFKKITGKGAYIFSGIKTLIKWNQEELEFIINGNKYSAFSAIIGKSSKYGGNFHVTPDAKLTEHFFQSALFTKKGKSDMLRYIWGILAGKISKIKDVNFIESDNIIIKGNAHIQIDGDYLGKTPAKIEIAKDALKLIYPK
jgi:YegS/Rv2252/BmrU family lipid kinase